MLTDSLANQFLIAMPGLADPNFFQTVTLICQHNEEGALGLVINRPIELKLSELLEQLDIEQTDHSIEHLPVHYGGPVSTDRGFVLHESLGNWDSTHEITPDLGLTASQDILASMAAGTGPQRALVAVGYAGWAAGQLEQELIDNAWLTVPGDVHILFEIEPDRRWHTAAATLGVDLNLLSDTAGHA